MKSRTQLWKEITNLMAIRPITPEIIKKVEELKEQRKNTPKIENRQPHHDYEDSEAERLIDYWNSEY